MTKQKSTKRALLLSALSLLMCVSMLIGSTFAWFTDSVTSSGNRIVAGNLSVDLLMDKENDGTYVSIADGVGDIFKEAAVAQNSNKTLWEPGKTQIVFLAVENTGNLALKYNIDLIVKGELASALEYMVIDNGSTIQTPYEIKDDWATIEAAFATEIFDVTEGVITAAPNGALAVGETNYFALAVHMKEEAENEYQGKEVNIDVTVVAAQDNVEGDSFGTDYDENAEFDKVEVKFPTALVKGQNGSYRFADNGANRGENAYYSVPTGDYTDAPFFSQEFAANNTFDGSGATFADVQVLANYCTEEGDVFEVKNVKSEGTLTVGSAGGTIIVNNCEFKAIRVSGSTDIIIKNSTVNGYGENRNGDAGGYGMFIIPAGDYKLSVLNNTINNCDMHCIAVQANGAGDIEVSGNTFKAWGSSTTKTERAAFKIWGDTVLAPTNMSSYAELGVEAKALVADILANNTFPSDLTAIGGTGTQVIFDFFDAAFSAAN